MRPRASIILAVENCKNKKFDALASESVTKRNQIPQRSIALRAGASVPLSYVSDRILPINLGIQPRPAGLTETILVSNVRLNLSRRIRRGSRDQPPPKTNLKEQQ